MTTHVLTDARRLAVMGGAYGNVPALDASLSDADAAGCDALIFLGDAIGCCGHSDSVVNRIRGRFDVRVAGNHEQQAAVGSVVCGCGYDDEEDERISCLAFERALESLSEPNRRWLGTWPDAACAETRAGRLLLCHGSPDRTNEFLYESELDEARLRGWLDAHDAVGMLSTHTGLPWTRGLSDGRFAANCGVVGKPDHDGDPAVHYAIVHLDGRGPNGSGLDGSAAPGVEIRRVAYDHEAWAAQLEAEGVDDVFITPLRTGVWTTGTKSLPHAEQQRPSAARAL